MKEMSPVIQARDPLPGRSGKRHTANNTHVQCSMVDTVTHGLAYWEPILLVLKWKLHTEQKKVSGGTSPTILRILTRPFVIYFELWTNPESMRKNLPPKAYAVEWWFQLLEYTSATQYRPIGKIRMRSAFLCPIWHTRTKMSGFLVREDKSSVSEQIATLTCLFHKRGERG